MALPVEDLPVSVWRQKSDFTPENGTRIFMYRNYFYREDLKVELTQLEEEDEKERFLEGSKHKRLIPVMLRWKSKKIPVRYLRCCIRSFVGRDTGKMQRTFAGKNL